jgi:diguanylate cyclase (GGDEF)-like protein
VPSILRENDGVFFAGNTEQLDDYAPQLVNAPRQGELPWELPSEVIFETPRTVPTSPAGDAEERLQKTAAAVASAARGQARRAFALEHIAFRDPLTELWNRRAFEDRFARLDTGLSPNTRAILMIDLDHLGAVNERSGHEAGDRALIGVAQCLADILRPSDFAARYGGDEFVVLLPDTSLTQAAEIGEQLRDRVERDLEWLQLTVSVGVCAADAEGRRRATLDVHQAVYEAKERGRNQVALVSR